MKKALSVRIKQTKFNGKQLFIVQIEHQEFRCGSFGVNTTNGFFTASNGFALKSSLFPCISDKECKFNVCGSSTGSDSVILTTNSKAYIDKLKVAVHEYNDSKSPPPKNDRKCSRDEYIIE
jgi:hypothetical protein